MYHSARTWSEAEISKRMRPNLERMPMLTQLHADGSASFSDGRSVDKIDSVIYCTGYKYKYRLLEHLNLIRTGEQPCLAVLCTCCFTQRPAAMPNALTVLQACSTLSLLPMFKACPATCLRD